MAALTIDKSLVRPLPGAVIIRMNAAAAITDAPGKAVAVDSNGKAAEGDADAAATAHVRGVIAGVGNRGNTDAIADQAMDVVTHGPVQLGAGAGMTPGAIVYNSVTAGGMDQTAPVASGDFPSVIGYALTATVLYVDPQAAIPVVIS